jgi:exodeoxyribonuclease X
VRIIDLETTGTDPETDAIIEIASVDLTHDLTLANPMRTFVDPGRLIPPHVSGVHHIVDEDVAGAPDLAAAVEPFRGADVYAAHNADFERAFMAANGIDLGPTQHGEPPAWICTWKCALRLWGDWPAHNNQALRYQLGLVRPFGYDREAIHPHRADSDVIVTAAILAEMSKLAPWGDLVRWSAKPALHTRLAFGKHRGERYDAVPADYLDWLADGRHDLPQDVRASARYWLEQRTGAAAA